MVADYLDLNPNSVEDFIIDDFKVTFPCSAVLFKMSTLVIIVIIVLSSVGPIL